MKTIRTEADLLNQEIRKALIEEMEGPGNQRRKAEMFKRYECLKDHTSVYVKQLLEARFSQQTVREMESSMTNISFARKVVDKLAKVYANGVKRTLPKDQESFQADIETLARVIKLNRAMKKWNRYFKAFRNALAYVKPVPGKFEGKHTLEVSILAPYLYDVVPMPGNPQGMLAVVLSDYSPNRGILYDVSDAATAGRGRTRQANGSVVNLSNPGADGLDDAIADGDDLRVSTGGALIVGGSKRAEEMRDPKNRRYVWWTESYHFVTDGTGAIVRDSADDDGKNPIEELPFVNLADDQDEQFWAEGGSDIADSAIKINAFLTNLIHVAIEQGYGQLVLTGPKGGTPKSVRLGPNHAITMEHDKEDPQPTAEFKSAGAPIDDLLQTAEMYIALMLSTNNLSTKGVSISLQGGQDFASGVAMILDKAESMEDVNEQADHFVEAEPEIWCLLAKWHKLFKTRDALDDALMEMELPEEPAVQVQFPPPAPIVSEKEKLEILEKRLQLKLSTHLEALMRDDPSLTEETAKEKLKKILEEAMRRQAQLGIGPGGTKAAPGDEDAEDADKDPGTDQGDEPFAPPKPAAREPAPAEAE